MRDFFFDSGAQPFVPGSQMCLNISINDDPFLEPTETFVICGSSQQNAVVILNDGCTNINIRDNEGRIIILLQFTELGIYIFFSLCSYHHSTLS